MTRNPLLLLSCCGVLLVGAAMPGAGAVARADTPPAVGSTAEPGPLETVAGTGEIGHQGDGGPAVDAALGEVRSIAFDDAGNLYVAARVGFEERGAYIRKVAPDGTISTVAGGLVGESDDSGIGTTPDGLAGVSGIDSGADGAVYIADGLVGRVLRVGPDEQPTVVAGSGDHGYAGDDGPATSAVFGTPVAVAVGDVGDFSVVDASGYIRHVDTDGIITTVAGTGEAEASAGDGGPAVDASFTRPMDVAVDAAGNIYVADVTRARASDDDIPSHRIRRIDTDGAITTIAGGETCGYTGDGGAAADAELCFPSELTVADDGTVYLVDEEHHQIRMILPDSSIESLPAHVSDPSALALGPDGALYVGDGDQGQVHRIPLDGSATTPDTPHTPEGPDATSGVSERWADLQPRDVTVIAGTGTDGFSGDGGPALDAHLSEPDDVAVGPDGTSYVLDSGNGRIRAIAPDGTMTTVAGGGDHSGNVHGPGPMGGDGRPATEAALGMVHGIDVAPDGSFYMADYSYGRVRKVDPAGVITTVAGTGEQPGEGGGVADGTVATHAVLGNPEDVAVAPDGSVYVSDSQLHRVFRIGLDGKVRVAAGNGSGGFSGDGGPATEAELEMPSSIDTGADGTLYITDSRDTRIRAVDPDGVITTIGGKAKVEYEDPDDDAPATEIFLNSIHDVAVDEGGTVYLSGAGAIQRIGTDGILTRLTETAAGASAVTLDGSGNLYFSQRRAHEVSVLPHVDEEPTATPAADGDGSGVPWQTAIIGVLLAAGIAAGVPLVLRRRSSVVRGR